MPSFRLSSFAVSDLMPRIPHTRGVLHRARPARRPSFPSPLKPLDVKPTAGTSRPRPGSPAQTPPSVALKDTGLTFHHAPPASAPSYNTGVVPDVLKWVQGSGNVRASAQAGAPLVRRKRVDKVEEGLGLSAEVIQEMRGLRLDDPARWTRKALCEKFNIPIALSAHLARLVPSPPSHRSQLSKDSSNLKKRWGFNKSVAREAREIRKTLW